MNEAELKLIVADSGRLLLSDGLAARTWGNISCLIDNQTMAITPSGLGYEGMTPDDIVSMNLLTGDCTGTRKPSSEKAIHIVAYHTFRECSFVIHTHQTYASAIGLTGLLPGFITEEEKNALGGLALAAYGLPGTEQLARNVGEAFRGGAHTVLMAHHGAVIVAKDRDEAFYRARLLESVCCRACKGRTEVVPTFDKALARPLTAASENVYGYAAYNAAEPVRICAADGADVAAQLDDMAQMIGSRIPVVPPYEQTVLDALNITDVVLVAGVGAICRASDPGDVCALSMLAEKACICHLHTRALGIDGQLSTFDVAYMRAMYLNEYAKEISGS